MSVDPSIISTKKIFSVRGCFKTFIMGGLYVSAWWLMSHKYKSLTISELLLSSSSSHSSSSSPSSSSSRRPQSLSSWRGDQAIASLNLKVILTRISIVHHHKVISKSINHAHSKCLCHEPYNWIIFFIVIIILSQSFQLSWKSWINRSISIKRNIEA